MEVNRLQSVYLPFTFYIGYILLLQVAVISASGVFEIRLDEFVNHAGRDRQGRCCRESVVTDREACSEHCETAFHVCLTHYQSSIGSGTKCTFGSATTSILGGNTITAKHTNSDGANLIRLSFNFTWPRAFSLVIEATHQGKRDSPGKLIARMETRGNIDSNTDWKTETQTQQEKILRYSYRVRCDQYHYGGGCSKYCRPRNDRFGHWSCDENGEKTCLKGWKSREGDTSYCLEPICLSGCNTTYGYCKRPDECICRDGWQGKFCNKCIAYPGCLHGTCSSSFQCNCDPGWGGMFCNHDLNYCVNHKPCKNGARCTNVGQGSFSCDCPPGFTGRECEDRASECDPNPCKNGARCTVLDVGYSCECLENFFGPTCENTHVTCQERPCQNGGDCLQESMHYRCRCKNGFRGVNCEIVYPTCSSTACLNGGTCRNDEDGFSCSCAPGFAGGRCQITVSGCDSSFCQNGGKCAFENRILRCMCPEGFVGSSCESRTEPCSVNPCKNGGECRADSGRYQCHCFNGFSGRNCETNPCAARPCKNGGKCVLRGDTFRCLCGTGLQGRLCEKALNTGDDASSVPYHDKQDTRIILLTKNDKSGLNTAQWITVCFASAFLLLVFVAVAVCVAYQNRGKAADRFALSQSAATGEKEGAVHSESPQVETVGSLVAQNDEFADSDVVILPAGAPSASLTNRGDLKSAEFPHGFQEFQGKNYNLMEQWLRRPGHAYSQCDVRFFKARRAASRENALFRERDRVLRRSTTENENLLPTYREACGGR